MVEYYKTKKGYYYKKTSKKTKRIKKDEYQKKTSKGGKIKISFKDKLTGGDGNNCKCKNAIDIITLEPIENDFSEDDINNFIIRDDKGNCYCFKIYDLYRLIFLTKIPIDINNSSKMENIRSFARDDINHFTNETIKDETLNDIVIKYFKWTRNRGPEKTISYNNVTFNRKDYISIMDEFEEHKNRLLQISSNTMSITPLTIFLKFAEDLLEDSNSNTNSNSNSSSSTKTRSVGSNNSARPSFLMSKNTLKAIISYIRDNRLY